MTKFAIYTKAKTKSGWKRIKDTKFDTKESAEAYGRKYHTDKYGAKMYKVDVHPEHKLVEDVPANSIGSGAIATFDPLLKQRRKKKLTDMLRRKLTGE